MGLRASLRNREAALILPGYNCNAKIQRFLGAFRRLLVAAALHLMQLLPSADNIRGRALRNRRQAWHTGGVDLQMDYRFPPTAGH